MKSLLVLTFILTGVRIEYISKNIETSSPVICENFFTKDIYKIKKTKIISDPFILKKIEGHYKNFISKKEIFHYKGEDEYGEYAVNTRAKVYLIFDNGDTSKFCISSSEFYPYCLDGIVYKSDTLFFKLIHDLTW